MSEHGGGGHKETHGHSSSDHSAQNIVDSSVKAITQEFIIPLVDLSFNVVEDAANSVGGVVKGGGHGGGGGAGHH